MAAWIAKFWPEVAAHATHVISFEGPMRGTQLADSLCTAGSCAQISWQMAMCSYLTTAATTAPLPTTTSFTSIGSLQDEVVFPQPQASYLDGAANIMLQTVCPSHVADHGSQLSDAVGYALVMDALTHDGPANPARVNPAVCLQSSMPGVDPSARPGSPTRWSN
jgi:triacylglycerol lipase